jgi:hypothetical protein
MDSNTTQAQRQAWSDYLGRPKIARPLPFLFFSQRSLSWSGKERISQQQAKNDAFHNGHFRFCNKSQADPPRLSMHAVSQPATVFTTHSIANALEGNESTQLTKKERVMGPHRCTTL